ncbi:hypothetical protein GCK72_011391 [Caenorhabditis remanei]|uniref:F-box domain-containing protein n=1 Tax=Caenorhabditis remanei TaxID=31234 RepID=A0A6A5H7N3_CAERE|nr:hypothetical protein GCK72_011391 [Caenorhabditis remanei]KAF1763125.1 hypothetical protein GCK72_011391 [Caenorhabditis remanei]
MAQVLNVPNFVEKYLDIDARLRLRKTCTAVREIINKKPLHIDCLHYKCCGIFILIFTNEFLYVAYKISKKGLNVENGDRVEKIGAKSDEERIEIIERDGCVW